MESNPVAIDGVLYTTNAPLGEVWAIDAKTGAQIWKYTPSYAGENPEQRPAVQPRQRWPQGRRRGRRGQGLRRPSRRSPHRTRAGIRQACLGGVRRLVQSERKDLHRPDLRQRHGHRRRRLGRRWWRQRHDLGLQGRQRRQDLDLERDPAPGQPGYKTWTNYGKGGNGTASTAAARSGSPRSSTQTATCSTSVPATRSRGTRAAPARTCTRDSIVALDLYTGRSSGTSRSSITTCGTRPAEQRRPVLRQVQGRRQDGQQGRRRLRQQGRHDVRARPREREAADPDRRGQGSRSTADGVNTLADAAGSADGQRPLQPGRLRPTRRQEVTGVNAGVPCTTPDAVTNLGVPFATAPRPTASRTRSVARTIRTTRRSTSSLRSR